MNGITPRDAFISSDRPQSVFVLVADVLGFKHRIATTPLYQVKNDYDGLLRTARERIGLPVFGPNRAERWEVGRAIFSDSIFLWCSDGWEEVQTLISSSAFLVDEALRLGWPLRGAIAYGECVINLQDNVFIGQPIVDAYLAEQSQEWVGIGILPNVTEHPKFGTQIVLLDDVIRYRVPIKRCSAQMDYAVHWGPYSSGASSKLKEMQGLTSRKSRHKYMNTIRYLSDTCQGMHALS